MHISERERDLPKAVLNDIMNAVEKDKSIISLGAGEPDFKLPKPLQDYIKKVKDINHYTPSGGLKELREALSKKLMKDNKINVNPDNIIITSGSQEAILLALTSTLDVSERVVVPDPCYLGYISAIELVNASPVSVPVNEDCDFCFDPDKLRRSVLPRKTKGIIINSPSNPTGSVFSKKLLEQISDIAVDNDLWIYSDEAYEKIVYDKKHVSIGSLNGMSDRVATFQTFSKGYSMCGFRVGYCAGPPNLIRAMNKAHTYTSIAPSTLSQKVALKALSLSPRYINSMVKEYRRRRDMIVMRLNSIGLHTIKPEGAFYTFSNIQNYSKDSFRFSKDLLNKAKVAVVPGAEFGVNGEGYIRCSYATEYHKIEEGMNRIDKFLGKKTL